MAIESNEMGQLKVRGILSIVFMLMAFINLWGAATAILAKESATFFQVATELFLPWLMLLALGIHFWRSAKKGEISISNSGLAIIVMALALDIISLGVHRLANH